MLQYKSVMKTTNNGRTHLWEKLFFFFFLRIVPSTNMEAKGITDKFWLHCWGDVRLITFFMVNGLYTSYDAV